MTLCFLVSSVAVFAQNDDEQGGETSETILQREQFINERRAGGPGKFLPENAYEKALQQKQSIPRDENIPNSITSSTSWSSVNPTGMFYQRTNANYISGRTNSIAFHPTDANTIYIAAAQGGVWKTTDGGLNWIVLTDTLGSISSGDISIDPNNPSILYYGTGELNYSGDSQYGAGIYKSVNAGLSWTKVATAAQVGNYISKIIVDPSNSNNVYSSTSNGFYRSTNAGTSWTQTLSLDASSLVMSFSNSQILFISSGAGQQDKIYKSTNGGSSWNVLTVGLPGSAGRIQLAISPDNDNYVYASEATSGGPLLGLYRTTNGGTSWTLMNNSTNYMSSQGWYDNAVVVVPGDPNKVVVAGLDIYYSSNGGTTLTQKTSWFTSTASNFSHADIHYLSYKGSTLYCCSDGGVYKSADNGTTWSDLNIKISTLQYESADYDPTNYQFLYGGTQDNNKQTTTNSGVVWIQRTTGDGGYTVVDPVNTNYVYGQYVNGSIQRSNNNGVSFTDFTPSGSTGGLFYNPYEMAPGNHNVIVFGRADVWKTTSAQTASSSSGWSQIASTAIVAGNVSAIGISPTDENKIYIGTSNGKILVTTNNGVSWSATSGFSYVSDLWVDSVDNNICYASLGGVSSNVRKTTNGGVSWSIISSNLPGIAMNSIVVKMSAPRTIFAGTDLGVYKSTNEGTSWVSFNTGFPNVEVYDLKYKEGPKILLAATHGRGCFIFNFNNTVLNLSLTINLQAYQSVDTISVLLRSSTFPYNIHDSSRGLGGLGIAKQISFSGAVNGIPYFIEVKHRNSIETWSKTAQVFSGNALSYSFVTANTQAFGNNMINVSGLWSFFTGDVNQDGTVDLSDVNLIYNDAFAFVSGYVATDLNGDNFVDLTDLSLAYNNSTNFVSVIRP